MKKFFCLQLSLSLLISTVSLSAAPLPAKKRGNATATKKASPVRVAQTTSPDSVTLLPKADVVAIVDIGRLFNEVLPKVKAAWPQQTEKMTKELGEFITETGIDPAKVKTVAIGLNMSGKDPVGAMIIDGLSLDAKQIEAIASKDKSDKSTPAKVTSMTYKGKTVFLTPAKKEEKKDNANGNGQDSSSGSPLNGVLPDVSLNMSSNNAYVQLDGQRLAIGDEAEVKAIIDALTGGSSAANISPKMSGAVQETKASGLIRFAVDVPDSARQMIAGQEPLTDLAVIKMVLGTLDVSDDLSVSLDARLRTGSSEEATKLETTLNGLLAMGKMMLGGNQDPMMVAINQLLESLKLNSQATDVGLTIKLPRTMFDQLLKEEKKANTSKTDK